MKRKSITILSVCLASVIAIGSIAAVTANKSTYMNQKSAETEDALKSVYDKISINDITGEGSDPAEITGAASAEGKEKEWYEYIVYSPQPVSSIRLDENRRFVFYDPYDYTSSMLMKITGEESEWSSANSLEISYTTGSSLSDGYEHSTNTETSVEVQKGRDESEEETEGTSSSTTKSWSNEFSATVGTTIGASATVGTGDGVPVKVEGTVSREVSASATVGGSTSEDTMEESNSSSTKGWSKVADRVTSATGSSTSTNTNWSTDSSKTVTKTFNAAYFNASGSPLQWKIVQYTVYMPMKYEVQCRINDEWVTTDSEYCLLTTMQGTCRAYMDNTATYYEHWGTGEPVQWTDFWSGFFSEDALKAAYSNQLYPDAWKQTEEVQ